MECDWWIGDSGAPSLSQALSVNTDYNTDNTDLNLVSNETGDSGATSLSLRPFSQ